MLHINPKSLQRLRYASRWFVLLLLVSFAGETATAQILSLSPGQVSAVTSTNSQTGSSNPQYTGPVSGLIVNSAQALTYDSQGDLFFVDAGSNVVRVVASGKGPIPSLPSVPSPVKGTVYTVAGSGSNTPSPTPLCGSGQDQRSTADSYYYGNGCPATDAILGFTPPSLYGELVSAATPNGQVALDASGNLYITDVGDNQVRVVYAAGTVPGLPSNLPPGNIYGLFGAPSQNNPVGLGQNDLGTGPPTSVAVDSFGDVWIAYGYSTYFGDNEGVVGVVVGTGKSNLPQLVEPRYLKGKTLTSGESFPIVPSGGAPWNAPAAVASDSFGNIYVTDSALGNNAVYVVYAGGTVPGLSESLQSQGQTPTAGKAYAFAGSGSLAPVFGQSVLATQVTTPNPTQISLDSVGDFYIGLFPTNNYGYGYIAKVDPSGNLALVAGGPISSSGTATICAAAVDGFGDGCPASQVAIRGPFGVAAAPNGDIYYTDRYQDSTGASTYALHKIDGSTSSRQFQAEYAGAAAPAQVVSVSNVDAQPLNISAINFPNGFTQVASGGVDCSAPATLAPGQSCLVGVQFLGIQADAYSGNVTITSDSTNADSGVNSIAVSGTAKATTGTSAQTITFTAPSTATYGQTITLNGAASSKLPVIYQASGPATLQANALTVTGSAGAITVTAYQPGDNGDTGNPAGWAAATPVQVTINAQPAALTVTAGNISQARTLPIPSLADDYTITGFVNGDTQATATTGAPALSTTATASSSSDTYPIAIAQGTLATTTNNYSLTYQSGTFTILPGLPQTITFTQTLPTVTYGVTPINLTGTATASTGLPVTYTVTGPATTSGADGSTLTITGAGTVTVTANQAGDATYAPAQPVTQSFLVQPTTLTFAANNLTMAAGSPPPALTYTVSGLVSPDTAAKAVSGTPALATTATSSSPVGTVVPITITAGSVTVSSNYILTSASFVNGMMTVVTGTPQTINFGALSNVTYGITPVVLSVTADSGLPVTLTVSSGPASIANNVLTVTGAGTVTVTATQVGNATYSPAKPVQQSFNVAQAPLTITANNITRLNDTANPLLTYTIIGLVNGDTAGVLSGTPLLSTAATPDSPPETYPITITSVDSFGNPITAANYSISFVPGTLTITSGGPAQNFTMTLSPQSLTIVDGQLMQTTISVTPVNYYQGALVLSCKGLPANVSCTFSPATLNVALYSSGQSGPLPIQGTLTISTSSAPVVGSLPQAGSTIYSAAITGWVSLLFGLVLAWQRKRLARYGSMWVIAMAVCLCGMAVSMTACGGSSGSSTSGLAASGTSTIQVVATDSNGGPSTSTNLVITIH